jgi:glyoxylase-like metal-dependent hydrolase (beta-lactamase superfamily II)
VRVLRPADGVVAFYDGRIEGHRFAPQPNWVDDGALSLGIASYAVVSGHEALVYDTHISLEHAKLIRSTLQDEGVRRFSVVLSHRHLDHIAGTAVFADCEVIACDRTAEHLARDRAAIEAGALEGPPPIDPLVLPTSVFSGRLTLDVGQTHVELLQTNIHSDDATVAWLPEQRLLLCGDTMEDTVTYVDEPESLAVHRANLDELRDLAPERIVPNHGDPDVIASGGYPPSLIWATQEYIAALERCRSDVALRDVPLRELIAERLSDGSLHYFAPYEDVHHRNVAAVVGTS